MTREPEEKQSSSLSLQTLLISSVSAVVAAAVVPLFWQRGSLIATAITPIVVAIASEALNRPAKAITAAAPKVARRSATGAASHAGPRRRDDMLSTCRLTASPSPIGS